jgi:glycosyltransferase involved in cell wall biosynthesis
MQVYGESVRAALSRLAPSDWIVDDLRSPEPSSGRANALRWNRFVSFPRSLRPAAGVFHILDHAHAHLIRRLPRERTVVTVHDIMPIVKWRGRLSGSRGRPPLLNLWVFSHLRRAAAIVADSVSTKNDLVALLGCDPALITVIPPGIDPCFRPYSDEERAAALTRLDLASHPRRRILLSGHQFYKNHEVSRRVIQAVARNHGNRLEVLWLSGSDEQARAMSEAAGVQVRVFRNLTRAQVTDAYNAADVLLFPSLHEGFGWPPLEAMACGVPVVTSTARALVETTTGAALTAEARDWQKLAELVQRALTDSKLRASLREQGLARVTRYTWDACARQLTDVYARVDSAA